MNSDVVTARAVSALRSLGAMCVYIDPEGGNGRGGLPDLLVTHPNCGMRLLEMKTGRRKLNDDQRKWHAAWEAAGGYPVQVCRSVEDALRACGLLPADPAA